MANVIINNVTYNDVPSVRIPNTVGGAAYFYDTTGATAAAGDILTGKSAYGATGSISGSMANNGSTSGTISTKAGTVTIPAGYTSGGTVSLAAAAIADCTAQNILAGKTILGQAGGLTVPTISQDSQSLILSIQ